MPQTTPEQQRVAAENARKDGEKVEEQAVPEPKESDKALIGSAPVSPGGSLPKP